MQRYAMKNPSGGAPCQIYGIPILQPTIPPEKYGNLSLQCVRYLDFMDLMVTDVVPNLCPILLGISLKNWKINGWNLQITHLERKLIFQTSMIMFHVNFQVCIFFVKTVGFC